MKYENKDNETLLKLQEDFFNGTPGAWSDLWVLSLKVCRRMIAKEREKKGFYLNKIDYEDKAIDATEYVLRRYKKKYKNGKKYRIEKNFISALYFGVIHSLYYHSEKDRAFFKVQFFDATILQKLKNVAIYDKWKIKTDF